MSEAIRKLPKKVYVFMENPGMEDEYLVAEESFEACAAKGECRLVGVYELTDTHTVTLEVKSEVIVKKTAGKQ